MLSIYSNAEGLPPGLVCDLLSCNDTYLFTNDPGSADFFAFPCHYQTAWEYSDYEYHQHGCDPAVRNIIIEKFEKIKELSLTYNKPIICFYLRDSEAPIPLENAIVFRSSLTATRRLQNEFALPTNGRPLFRNPQRNYDTYQEWKTIPTIGFVGQSIALQLPKSLQIKMQINNICKKINCKPIFALRFNYGYLARRESIMRLSKSGGVRFQYRITNNTDYFIETSRYFYCDNLMDNMYALTASGHGNYSYRFYEIMEAGRIPLFVNTDCVLPLQEMIDYKNLVVWTEEDDLEQIEQNLLSFHARFDNPGFIAHQQKIKNTWSEFLAGANFYKHISFYLRHFR